MHSDLTNGLDLPEKSSSNLGTNGNDEKSLSRQKIEHSSVNLETWNWNSLNLDTERTSNAINSSSIGVALDPNHSDWGFTDKNDDNVDDGWEFKTAEAMFQSADGGYKEEQESTKSGSVVVQNGTDLSSSVWSSPTSGTGP